jgi:hypothetical protein
VKDFNHDNQLDIVETIYGSDSIGILLARSNGSFDIISTYSTGIDSTSYFVVTNSKTDNIIIFLGYNNDIFTIWMIYFKDLVLI